MAAGEWQIFHLDVCHRECCRSGRPSKNLNDLYEDRRGPLDVSKENIFPFVLQFRLPCAVQPLSSWIFVDADTKITFVNGACLHFLCCALSHPEPLGLLCSLFTFPCWPGTELCLLGCLAPQSCRRAQRAPSGCPQSARLCAGGLANTSQECWAPAAQAGECEAAGNRINNPTWIIQIGTLGFLEAN